MKAEGNPLCVNSHALAEDWMRCHQPEVIFDLGCHKGGYLKWFYDLCPKSKVHAFEPHPRLCDQIRLDYGHRDLVINRVAVADHCNTLRGVQFYNVWTLGTDADKPDLTIVPADSEHPDNNRFDVRCVTLDSYCAGLKVFPKFLKVDVDGYEYRFLKGARQFLKQYHPVMMMELSYLMLRLGDSVEAWVRELLDLGYRFSSMDGRIVFSRLEDILDHYPYNTSFDVMLL